MRTEVAELRAVGGGSRARASAVAVRCRCRAAPPVRTTRHARSRRVRRRRCAARRLRRGCADRIRASHAAGRSSARSHARRRARRRRPRARRCDAAQSRDHRDAARRKRRDASVAARHLCDQRRKQACCASGCRIPDAIGKSPVPAMRRSPSSATRCRDAGDLGAALKRTVDIERIAARIALRNARPRDLSGLRDTLGACR